jgi:flavin reductase (DIM6/NTAB) family NADH-FMN oxidoreductase RutF
MDAIRKKPWNRVNIPVYSVSSADGVLHNMNICTYATPVSMQPKRYVVALYRGTKTLDNVQRTRHFVLQILGTQHTSLVRGFSRFSGSHKDKLKSIGRLLTDYNGFKILTDAIAVIEMRVMSLTDGGDHMVALCEVVSYKNLSSAEVLTLDHLREKKIISV